MEGKEKKAKRKFDSSKMKKVCKKIFTLKTLFIFMIIAVGFSIYQLLTRDKFVFDVSYLSSYSTSEDVDVDITVYSKNDRTSYNGTSNYYKKQTLSDKLFDKLTNDNVKVTVSLYDADGKKVRGAKEKVKTEFATEENISLELPKELEDGVYSLKIKAQKGLYHDEVEKKIDFLSTSSDIITISMDKGIYKPGDEVKFRALITDNNDNKPIEKNVEISIYDGNSNRVFYEESKTSEFGIISGVFNLGEEVNSGTYILSVKIDGKEKSQGFNVESYTEERFEVVFNNLKSSYKTTEDIEFEINTKYFFGEPVVDAEVVVTDVENNKQEVLHTDSTGLAVYTAEKRKKGNYSFDVEITDKSNYFVKKTNTVVVNDYNFDIEIVPEFSDLVIGVKNRIYIYVKDLEGKPVETICKFRMGTINRDFTTDEDGVGFVDISSADISSTSKTITVSIESEDGLKGNTTELFDVVSLSNIIRTDKVLYSQGDSIDITIGNYDTNVNKIYAVKNGELIKTIDVSEENQEISLDNEYGLIDLYIQGKSNSKTQLNKRTIFIKPNMEMEIKLSTDSSEYSPSDNMKLNINSSNDEASAYLVSIIDTANLNMADNDLNIDKVKLALEDINFTDGVDAATVYVTIMSNSNETELEKLLTKQSVSDFNVLESRLESDFDGDIYIVVFQIVIVILVIITAIITISYNLNPNQKEMKVFNIISRSVPLVIIFSVVTMPILEEILDISTIESFIVSLVLMIILYVKFIMKYEKELAITLYEILLTIITLYIVSFILAFSEEYLGFPILIIVIAILGLILYKIRNKKIVKSLFNFAVIIVKTFIMLIASNILFGIVGNIFDIDSSFCPFFLIVCIICVYSLLYKYRNNKKEYKENQTKSSANTEKHKDLFYYIGVGTVIILALLGLGIINITRNFSTNVQTDSFTYDNDIYQPDGFYDNSSSSGSNKILSESIDLSQFDAKSDNSLSSSSTYSFDWGSIIEDVDIGFDNSKEVNQIVEEEIIANEENQNTVKDDVIKIRNVFLESLAFMPEVIAENGDIDVDVKLSDNITTWKVQVVGNTKDGDVAYTNTEFKVFKDFFVDFTVPNNLRVGDKISIPATIYNYTEDDLNVELKINKDNWFNIENATYSNIYVEAKGQFMVYIDIEILSQGDNKLRVEATANGLTDIIERDVKVGFNGVEISEIAANGNSDENISGEVIFNNEYIDGSGSVTVNIYPTLISFALESMDSILKMPSGCFEQVSSSLYPDIMVLSYLENTGTGNEYAFAKTKALKYINSGYQKLLTYEVAGERGGFSLYGHPNAETVLTAYGLLELYDLSKVYSIDENVLERMELFLSNKQNSDGSFKITGSYVPSITGSNNKLAQSSYIAWAISEYNPESKCLTKAVKYIKENIDDVTDNYTLALMVNVLVNTKDKDVNEYLEKLINNVKELDDGTKYLGSTIRDYMGSRSSRMNVQTTALLSMALSKSDKNQNLNNELLNYIVNMRTSTSWGTTQSTVFALRAINLYTEKTKTKNQTIKVTIGDETKEVELKKNGIEFVTFDFDNIDDELSVRYDISGIKSNIYYEVIKNYYVDYDDAKSENTFEITREFSSTELKVNDVVEEHIIVKNVSKDVVSNIMVEAQIPQGFVLVTDTLDKLVANGIIEKYESNYGKVLIYLRNLESLNSSRFTVQFRALYPVDINGGSVQVYDYYNPESIEYLSTKKIKVTE